MLVFQTSPARVELSFFSEHALFYSRVLSKQATKKKSERIITRRFGGLIDSIVKWDVNIITIEQMQEMLLIKNFTPSLNVQSHSLRAKVFT